jgi:hypothetical protein
MRWSLCTKIWQLGTVRGSGRFTYVPDRPCSQTGWRSPAANFHVQILRVVELEKTADIKRPYIKQLVTKGLKFPLPHRVQKTNTRKVFAAKRPSTFA